MYFVIKELGFNCEYNKNNCPQNQNCFDCLKNRLKEGGFEINDNTRIIPIESEEKRLEMEQELIWQKFLDVLNIKHIMIMDKESGLTLIDFPVSGVEIDANLLSGFIQANITFSESGDFSRDVSSIESDHLFYEFQYQNFNILLMNGEYARVCLILDHKASAQLRSQISRFLREFEHTYRKAIVDFKNTRTFYFANINEYIVRLFDIKLIFPMILAQSIAPNDMNLINKNYIQKAIINFAKEYLVMKPFFFINNLFNKVKKVVKSSSRDMIVLYEIYQLLEKKILIPTSIETIVNNIEITQEATHQKISEIKVLDSLVNKEEDFSTLEKKARELDENSVIKMIRDLVRQGKAAEKALTYHFAEREYQKALFLAKKFNFIIDINKISFIILELEKKTKQIEIDHAIEKGEHAEKNKDYINSIYYYQKALDILYDPLFFNASETRIKKLKKKILKLRTEI